MPYRTQTILRSWPSIPTPSPNERKLDSVICSLTHGLYRLYVLYVARGCLDQSQNICIWLQRIFSFISILLFFIISLQQPAHRSLDSVGVLATIRLVIVFFLRGDVRVHVTMFYALPVQSPNPSVQSPTIVAVAGDTGLFQTATGCWALLDGSIFFISCWTDRWWTVERLNRAQPYWKYDLQYFVLKLLLRAMVKVVVRYMNMGYLHRPYTRSMPIY